MGGVKTISIIVAANIKGLEASLGKANKSIAGFASNAARIGSTLTFGVTAPLVAMGKSAFDTFSQFENSMMKVNTVTGATAEEFKMLTDEAKRLGATTQFTASQVADLQLILGRKGFDPQAIKGMQQSILDLALATGEDLSLAAEVVSKSINAFGLETEQSAKVANTLASAAANSSVELSTFATAFGHAGASAKAVGVDIEELSAMMGVLMDNGIKASKAGTGLRKVFMKLNEEGIPFGSTLENLSNGTMSLSEAQGLVGTTAANQLLILSENRDKLAELTDEYETNTDRLIKMAEAMGKTTLAKVLKMNSAIESLKLELGALLSDRLMPLIKFLTHLANKFSALDDTTQNLIITIGIIAASIGPLALIIGGLGGALVAGLSAMGSFVAAAAPVVLVVGAIVVIVDKLIQVLGILGQAVIDNGKALKERFQNIANSIGNFFIDMFNKTVTRLREIASKFGITIFENFTPSEELTIIPDDELTKFGKFSDSASKFMDTYKNFKSSIGEGIMGVFDFSVPGGDGATTPTKEPKTRSLQEAYDAIFGDGAWAAYQEDKRLKEEQLASTQRWTNSLNSLAVSLSENFAQSFADTILSGQNFLQGLGQIFADLAKQITSMIIKALVLSAILSFTGLGATAQAQKAFGADQSFKGLLGGMFGGGFASGGQPPLGKVSLVGEQGPELFVPNSQKGTIIPNHALGGSVIPDVRISGDDLLIVFDKAQRSKSRR
jgi:hypothetical protein